MAKQPEKIKHKGHIYVRADLADKVRTAQLQEMLMQFDSQAGELPNAIKAALANVYKSAMGMSFDKAISDLNKLKDGFPQAIDQLAQTLSDAAGIAAAEGKIKQAPEPTQ